ncbi:MAG: hypothetical protein NC935_02255 [Candidatus Omnitrophica bacterium]|nr:hypothetical protein [Candidatus Omnitrophota bacterium]
MWTEIPRVKFEKGEITLDVFRRGDNKPIVHIKGNIKNKEVRRKIAKVKELFGSAFFSDIIDFVEISYPLEEAIKELKEISKNG